jgi:hypothetical protein
MLVVYDEEAIRAQIESVLARLGVTGVRFQRRHLGFRIGYPLLLAWRYVDEAELFTFYDALARRHGRRARPNRLASVGAQLMTEGGARVPPAGGDDILFIGTNVLATYAPFGQAMAAVMRAADGRRLLYLRHRRDDVAKVAALAAKYGFESHGFDLPLELVFHHLWAAHRPAVWTFGTTATDTLQPMYGDLAVRVFRLDPAGFTSTRLAAAFDSIYAHYRANLRAEVVQLDAAAAAQPTGQAGGVARSQTASK